jgi:hypothetical protein
MEGSKAHKKQKKDKGKKRERDGDVAAAAPEPVAPVTDLGALLLGGSAKSFEDAGLASLFEPSKVRGRRQRTIAALTMLCSGQSSAGCSQLQAQRSTQGGQPRRGSERAE